MYKNKEQRKEQGFTLIELLIAIVVVGILAAVAIVGIGGLTDTGGTSACKASADAATAASAAYYANNGNTWPSVLSDLTGATPKVFEEPAGHIDADTATGGTMKVGSWTMTMTGGNAAGTSQPAFDSTC
jgi:prepilin-type N-terminal cleavage/methylation domain-containing protein